MSVVKPEINTLLEKCENNPYLLCSLASKRACDINNMVRSQHLRVTAVNEVDDITIEVAGKDTVSEAMDEIASGILSYDKPAFDETLRNTDDDVF